jgi:hypothetical protein
MTRVLARAAVRIVRRPVLGCSVASRSARAPFSGILARPSPASRTLPIRA